MDKEFLIILTMARFSTNYETAKKLVKSLKTEDELWEYFNFLQTFPTYSQLMQKYGGN